MKMGLLACTTLSALVSVAQAAQEPGGTAEPLRLTGPQMDIATAGGGTIGVWITSAAAGLQPDQFIRWKPISQSGQSGANIQLVVKISGLPVKGSFDSSMQTVIPSTEGTINIGDVIIEGERQ